MVPRKAVILQVTRVKRKSISFPKEGSGSQKLRDDLKRRRGGQQQEWRMKTPPSHSQIPTQFQSSGAPRLADFSSSSSESSVLMNGKYRVSSPLKIRPLAAHVDHPGLPSNVVQESSAVLGSAMEESKKIYHDSAGYSANGRSEGNENGLGKEDEEEPLLLATWVWWMNEKWPRDSTVSSILLPKRNWNMNHDMNTCVSSEDTYTAHLPYQL